MWVKLDYTCNPLPPQSGDVAPRMTDFNNPTEAAPRGPLTPPHKENTYSHITLRPQKHPPEPNISEASPWQPGRENTRNNFNSSGPSGRKEAQCHVVLQRPAAHMSCLCLIKLPHSATGGGLAGSRLRSNKYLFVKSKTAA